MNQVRMGVIGAGGGMAGAHQAYFGGIEGLDYAAASELSEDKRKKIADTYGVETFADASEMIASGSIDAVLIACPHFAHPRYAMEAFDAGVHVLCEKPVAVTAKAAQEVNEAYARAKTKHPGLVFAGMFNQRTDPVWKEIKRLCSDGSLGELVRVSWTITTWFRTQAYYDSSDWRATWSGEGGGVLLNQCPHNLDLLQWFVGMPSRVSAHVGLGRHHHIEVEDDVTAVLEYPNGAIGTFVTSTGQSPGVNRLEIVGERGTIVADAAQPQTFSFRRNDEPVPRVIKSSQAMFGEAPHAEIVFTPSRPEHVQHEAVTRNFIETLLSGAGQDALVAPGTEMIHALELGNAMLMAGIKNQPVELPSDREAYDRMLGELQANSVFQKNQTVKREAAMDKSF